jgi:hypothetical protein
MKKVDPKIKVSGNAWSWAPQKHTADFMTGAPAAHDFFSYHHYALGKPAADQMEVRARAPKITESLERIANLPGIDLDSVWLDEWNMFGTYYHDEKTKHMASPTAALYDLMVYKNLASRSTKSTICAWNEFDGIYGKIGTDFKVRETGKLMAAMNAHFIGDMIQTEVSDAESIVAYAIKNQGRVFLAVGNLTENDLSLDVREWRKNGTAIARLTRDEANIEKTAPIAGESLTLEAGRVVILDLGRRP